MDLKKKLNIKPKNQYNYRITTNHSNKKGNNNALSRRANIRKPPTKKASSKIIANKALKSTNNNYGSHSYASAICIY